MIEKLQEQAYIIEIDWTEHNKNAGWYCRAALPTGQSVLANAPTINGAICKALSAILQHEHSELGEHNERLSRS